MFVEIYFQAPDPTAPDPAQEAAVQTLVTAAKAGGWTVRLTRTSLYSYQGGHERVQPPRAADWAGEGWGRELGAYAAQPGDALICLRTRDRYGYVPRRGLRYFQAEDAVTGAARAAEWLAAGCDPVRVEDPAKF